jgi:hypothetical protein
MKTNKNQYYIVRAKDAGVFFSKIEEASHDELTMTDVRKIWYWSGACAVEQLAMDGTTNPNKCKLTVIVPAITIADPIQIIPCTEKATKSLAGVAIWQK